MQEGDGKGLIIPWDNIEEKKEIENIKVKKVAGEDWVKPGNF